jgi:hypothetical protein
MFIDFVAVEILREAVVVTLFGDERKTHLYAVSEVMRNTLVLVCLP